MVGTVVVLDNNEKENLRRVFEERAEQLPFVRDTLKIGDFELHKDTVDGPVLLRLERKTVKDLAISIKIKHWRNQKMRLMADKTCPATAFIIEGSWEEVGETYEGVKRSGMIGALTNTYMRDGMAIFRTANEYETWELVGSLAKKLAEHGGTPGLGRVNGQPAGVERYTETVHAKKAKNMTAENCFEVMLAHVPGLSAKMAAVLRRHYPNMRALIEAYASCENDKARSLMLADIHLDAVSGKKPRRLGPAISNRVFEYLYGTGIKTAK